MSIKDNIKEISGQKWLIPKHLKPDMRVQAVFYATDDLLRVAEDAAVDQLTNVACLPGVIEPVIGMPDMHWGYGLPMGAVGAFDMDKGVISAGCTGFDINCGVHMLTSNVDIEEIKPHLRNLIDTLFRNIPCGVGSKSKLRLGAGKLDDVLVKGARWAVEKGFGVRADLDHMEERGCIEGADPTKVSDYAKKRGGPQIGTLGGGNHFLEVQAVDEIYDEETARAFGIARRGQITVMVHCGSRGLGHQVASDYLQIHERAARKFGIKLPDRQLVCAPTTSREGQDYFAAMKAAANYAFANRQMIAHWVRESFGQVLGKSWERMEMRTLYDVCHNICKLEEHMVQGRQQKVYVHRKGSTRAFPPGHSALPEAYRATGQPVLIAGSMGTASYILVGTPKSMEEAFGSSCHGAGRSMSRKAAIRKFRGEIVKRELEDRGEVLRSTHPKVLAEESPDAYKDVDAVVECVHLAGISKKIARVVPLGVAKG